MVSVTWIASVLPCDSKTYSRDKKARLHTAGMLKKKEKKRKIKRLLSSVDVQLFK